MNLLNRKRRQRSDLALMQPNKRREVIAFMQRGCVSADWADAQPASQNKGQRQFYAAAT